MKLDRLLGIVTILLQKEKVTAPELAARFEVSRRTIQRDIDDICQAGIPIITYQGGNGGISIADSFKLDKSVLSIDELQSIITGLRSLASVANTSHIERLIAKLSPQGESITSLEECIFIDLSSHYRTSLAEKITLMRAAILDKSVVVFDYYSDKGLTRRAVEPYVILFRWSAWYLLGYCLNGGGFRLFKLNRMWRCRVIDETFNPREVPAEKLDPGEYFVGEQTITIVFDRSVEYRLVEEYGPDSYEITEDGRLRLSIPYTNKNYILSWVMGFGDQAEVIDPPELVSEIRTRVRKMLRRYEHDS